MAVEARRITRLPEAVVNRIAAGEIIQRPSNALKELLENALDAGSTRIVVTCKEGGLKLLQIQDNGSGIHTADLPILCERFTTSKLRQFEDLQAVQTYGFRGEALASISHVAHLSVTTKTRDDAHAWRASYHDGKLVRTKDNEGPVPCAGNDGTLISVEDLFYNTPQRLKALRSPTDEYNRIVGVVQSYAIHNAGIAMSCKKSGSTTADVNMTASATTLDNLGFVYGESVRKELLHVEKRDEELKVELDAWASSPNYQGKRGTYLFFINHRLVDSGPIRRALDSFYARILAKGAHPFVYLALQIDPRKVDVNVHPTKKEVHFENEDEVIEMICDALAQKLEEHTGSRSFKVQTLLTGQPGTPVASTSASMPPPSSKVRKVAPNKLVRTDAASRTLESFMPMGTASVAGTQASEVMDSTSDHSPAYAALQLAQAKEMRTRIPQSECALASIQTMRKQVLSKKHSDLEAIVRNHIFVGVADLATNVAMVQHQTRLYVIDYRALSEELFYQLGLRQFGRVVKINLQPAPSIEELVRLAVESDETSNDSVLPREAIIKRICQQLVSSREMLAEYFSFCITEDGKIDSLPLLLPGYKPNMNRLPLFLVRIGVYVNWKEEQACFESFLRELAYFYAPLPASQVETWADESFTTEEDNTNGEDEAKRSEVKRMLEHVIFPAAKQYLVPPESLLEKDFTCVTSLENLYRVFERC